MDPELKQRMVGTAVLVGLAVIFVPMILDGPVAHQPAPKSTGVPLTLPEPLAIETSDASPTPDTRDEQPVPAALEPTRDAPARVASGWAVQLGAFSTQANADAFAKRLAGADFDAFVQRIEADNGTIFRVRIGPVADRDAALNLAERVSRVVGESGVVVEHP